MVPKVYAYAVIQIVWGTLDFFPFLSTNCALVALNISRHIAAMPFT